MALAVLVLLLGVLIWLFVPRDFALLDITQRPTPYVEPRPLAEPPLSFVTIPISLSMQELERRVNAELPEKFVNKQKKYAGRRLAVSVVRTGPAKVSGKGKVLRLQFPLAFSVYGKRESLFKPRIKTNGALTVFAEFELGIAEDWTPKVESRATFRWDKKPRLRFGPFSIRVSEALGEEIQEALDKKAADLRKKARESLDFKAKAEDGWKRLHEPRLLRESPETWLAIQPRDLFLEPLEADDATVRLSLGISAVLTTHLGTRPPSTPLQPLPSLKQRPPAQRGFDIRVPVFVNYEGLLTELRASQTGREIELPQGTVTLRDFEAYTAGRELVIGVSFKGDADGWWWDTQGKVYFTGVPAYDPDARQLRVDNFNFTREVDNPLVRSATWILQDRLRQEVAQQLVWDVTDSILRAQEEFNQDLNRSLGEGMQLWGEVIYLNFEDLRTEAEGMAVNLRAGGELAILPTP
ncbi:MAG: DUF4403 family protein [Nevskiales bacterium]